MSSSTNPRLAALQAIAGVGAQLEGDQLQEPRGGAVADEGHE